MEQRRGGTHRAGDWFSLVSPCLPLSDKKEVHRPWRYTGPCANLVPEKGAVISGHLPMLPPVRIIVLLGPGKLWYNTHVIISLRILHWLLDQLCNLYWSLCLMNQISEAWQVLVPKYFIYPIIHLFIPQICIRSQMVVANTSLSLSSEARGIYLF